MADDSDSESNSDTDPDRERGARMELEPDAIHQSDAGYYFDCPQCGSPATVENVVQHGRCNAYLGEQEDWMEFDVGDVSCSAKLWLELAYTSDSEPET